MWERVEIGRQDSDTTLFLNLMYYGEMAAKLAVAAMVAAIGDDKDRSRYRATATLVRADGIGDWARVLDDLVTGPPAQYLDDEARTEQRELTQKCGPDTWQYKAIVELHACQRALDPATEPLPPKVDGRRWFRDFAWLRNKTRGHGAPGTEQLRRLCPHIEASARLFADNFSAFRREWAFLHRNLSGKYRVTKLGNSAEHFDTFKHGTPISVPDGLYVAFRT